MKTQPRDAAKCGIEDAETYLAETDETREEIAALVPGLRRYGPSDGLINAMGRSWVLAAAGAPDDSEESWSDFGLPWCQAYDTAYIARIEEG